MNRNRRRGAAAGWIILIVVLAVLGGLVAWKMVTENQGGTAVTTQPSAR